jgi:hypothetical protein
MATAFEEMELRVRDVPGQMLRGGHRDPAVVGAVEDQRRHLHLPEDRGDVDLRIRRPRVQDALARQSEQVARELLGELSGVGVGDDGLDEIVHRALDVARLQRRPEAVVDLARDEGHAAGGDVEWGAHQDQSLGRP